MKNMENFLPIELAEHIYKLAETIQQKELEAHKIKMNKVLLDERFIHFCHFISYHMDKHTFPKPDLSFINFNQENYTPFFN